MKLFTNTINYNTPNLTKEELSDSLLLGYYKSTNYLLTEDNLLIKISDAKGILGTFQLPNLYVEMKDNELLCKYIITKTQKQNLKDEEITLGDFARAYISDGYCRLSVKGRTYVITPEQYEKIAKRNELPKHNTPIQEYTSCVRNVCPYCLQEVKSYFHTNICELIRG